MATLIADTTAVFEALAGTTTSKADARAAMQAADTRVKSEHVEREYKRILFDALVAVVTASEKEADMASFLARSAMVARLEQRLSAFAQRLSALLETRSTGLAPAARARQLLRGDAQRRFDRLFDEERRASGCALAVAAPQETRAGTWELKRFCKRREGICQREQLLDTDQGRWEQGAGALVETGKAPLVKLGRKALEMTAKPELRTGKNCSHDTGDLAIALDCHPGEVLLTTDHGFEALGPAMGFTVRKVKTN